MRLSKTKRWLLFEILRNRIKHHIGAIFCVKGEDSVKRIISDYSFSGGYDFKKAPRDWDIYLVRGSLECKAEYF